MSFFEGLLIFLLTTIGVLVVISAVLLYVYFWGRKKGENDSSLPALFPYGLIAFIVVLIFVGVVIGVYLEWNGTLWLALLAILATTSSAWINFFYAALHKLSERSASNVDKEQRMNEIVPQTVKILFLAANPTDTTRLRLDEEIRAIDQVLRQAEFRNRFELQQHWAVRVTDIQSYFLRHKADIIHFSGHGSVSSDIILEDSSGSSHPVSSRALSQLFSVLKDNIRCVVLNACYSEKQARSIAEHIDCVVGMSKGIGDQSAIAFAAAFYQAIGYGRDVKTAFELGCIQIDLESLDDQDVPKLLSLRSDPKDVHW